MPQKPPKSSNKPEKLNQISKLPADLTESRLLTGLKTKVAKICRRKLRKNTRTCLRAKSQTLNKDGEKIIAKEQLSLQRAEERFLIQRTVISANGARPDEAGRASRPAVLEPSSRSIR